jgi:hypothetical protein
MYFRQDSGCLLKDCCLDVHVHIDDGKSGEVCQMFRTPQGCDTDNCPDEHVPISFLYTPLDKPSGGGAMGEFVVTPRGCTTGSKIPPQVDEEAGGTVSPINDTPTQSVDDTLISELPVI